MYRTRFDIEFDAHVDFGEVCDILAESVSRCEHQPDQVTVTVLHKSGVYGIGMGDYWPQALLRAYEYQER